MQISKNFLLNSKTKSIALLSFICCALVFALSACSPSAPKNQEAGKDAQKAESTPEITFMIPDWGAPTDAMLKEFEEQHKIKVNLIPTSWDDIRNKISTAAAGNTIAADVYEVDWSWLGELASAQWLKEINLSSEDFKDIPTAQSFTYNDKLYAVPYANDFRVAYYNKDDYQKVGLQEAPKTWDEAISAAQKIKEAGLKSYPISLPGNADENLTTTILWLSYTRNGKSFNDDGSINKESFLDALSLLNKMYSEKLIDPANMSSSGMDAYRKITSDDTSFMVGPSSFTSRITAADSLVNGKVDPIRLPGKMELAEKTVPFAEAVGISAHTKYPEAAETFVKWYTSKETQIKLNEELQTIPTRTSVLSQLISEGKIQNAQAMLEMAQRVESPFPHGVPVYYAKMSAAIFNAGNEMLLGKISPEEACSKIDAAVNDLLKK